METACAFWSVLLTPQFPLIAHVTEFINVSSEVWMLITLSWHALKTTGSYKGVNRDLWNMVRNGLSTAAWGAFIHLQHHIQMLEFCRDTLQDLSNFEADGVSRIHYIEIAVADVLTHLKAWPTVIDDFVRWKIAQTDAQPADSSVGDA
jgi:DCN1-like protein 4/5